ncbi:Glutamate-cysteine ligase [Smittium culicis]|uniref:Glutamate--cysteine ligase n=1 Tax=Smittium culicis TaxID=133412 RepID=A0A1R1YK00_9FUNG|nr:Glutamate-cysteine ligase [Smittium culicis]OMJ27249.1 Glutamate-cysteine ligase [Smittium culicis]
MGLLSLGTPLDWEEAKKYSCHVRRNGIQQFLNIWNKLKTIERRNLLWGDEIEYIIVEFDEDNEKVRLSKCAAGILDKLVVEEEEYLKLKAEGKEVKALKSLWRPEFGDFMVEGTPGEPYGSNFKDLTKVEPNMRYRRQETTALLGPNQFILSVSTFPSMGNGDWLTPHFKPDGKFFQSLFLPDEIINPHPRFRTLAANIRQRRGSKVEINIPVFHDLNTPKPFIDNSIPWDRNLYPGDSEAKNGAAKPDHIYMDAMGFGMGCCCLQVTFQASDLNEARRLYDQLAPITAIAMSLSASTPILKGYLADTDCRWNIISASVDDRTPEERGLKPLTGKYKRILKSRYGTIDSFLGSNDGFFREEFNDIKLEYDQESYDTLKENGVDELLAKHISHLFIRDPLVLYKELLDLDNENSSDHFENIQSTNWQNVRFKPPPPNSDIGWRVEFRPIEIQLTDFENAAFSVFIILLSRAILSFDLDFYIPVSKMDINMERAHARDSVLNGKFFFRKNVFSRKSSLPTPLQSRSNSPTSSDRNIFSVDKHGHENQSMEKEKSIEGSDESINSSSSKPFIKATSPSDIYSDENKSIPHLFSKDYPTFSLPDVEYLPVSIEEMTVQEIMCGQQTLGGFPGLLSIVENYLNSSNIDVVTMCKFNKYLEFIRQRATGKLKTNARYFRDFVSEHKDYKKDSIVNEKIMYDLMKKCTEISNSNCPPS